MSQHTSSSTGRVCTEYTRELPRGFVLLLFYIRAARRKAISVATMEALSLLQGLGAVAMIGGPLSEVGGIFWVAMPGGSVVACIERLPRLGYPSAVDLAQPADEPPNWVTDKAESVRIVRWKRKSYRLLRLYEEDCDLMRESAPDRRVFLLETADSTLRDIRGYRGNSSPLGRRGLPVCDARMLVNVVLPPNGIGTSKLFLDPFAGAGGVVLEAQALKCAPKTGQDFGGC